MKTNNHGLTGRGLGWLFQQVCGGSFAVAFIGAGAGGSAFLFSFAGTELGDLVAGALSVPLGQSSQHVSGFDGGETGGSFATDFAGAIAGDMFFGGESAAWTAPPYCVRPIT